MGHLFMSAGFQIGKQHNAHVLSYLYSLKEDQSTSLKHGMRYVNTPFPWCKRTIHPTNKQKQLEADSNDNKFQINHIF